MPSDSPIRAAIPSAQPPAELAMSAAALRHVADRLKAETKGPQDRDMERVFRETAGWLDAVAGSLRRMGR